jgi:hypothetical protein
MRRVAPPLLAVAFLFCSFQARLNAGEDPASTALPVSEPNACPHIADRVAEIEANRSTTLDARSVFPAGTIDGAEHPEKIPDEVAFRLFMRSFAVQRADPMAARRSRAKLRSLGFSLLESEAVIAAADEYVHRAAALPARADAESARDQISALSREIRASLPSRLTPAAAARFERHLKEVKRAVRIIPAQ